MKKIFMVLIVFLSLLVIPNFEVRAIEDSFYEGEYINGEYIKKFKNGASTGKYEHLKFFRRSSDNQAVYCIQLWETLSSNKSLPGYDNNQEKYAGIDVGVFEKVMLVAYYGYGYGNHTEDKWYAITQYMIWKLTAPDSNIYFTDTLNGKKITKYENEMNEIEMLIQAHYNIPSFNNQTFELRYNQETIVTDYNNELSKFDVSSYNVASSSISNNNLIVKSKLPGNSFIKLTKNGKKYNNNPIVYIDDQGQNIFAPGNFYPIEVNVNFNIPVASITINKLDKDTNSNIGQGDAKLKGTRFQLIDEDDNIVQEKTINSSGTLTFSNIGFGNYKIKEVEAGIGYVLNNGLLFFKVQQSKNTITFYNKVIKNTIIFKKYTINPITGVTKEEENAKFSIYNMSGNLVNTFETNEEGLYQITLPYGDYLIKQTSGTKNHYYIDDFKISIKENNKIQTINLYNEELTANIRIINTDNDSNLPLLEAGSKFKIKNIETNEYIKDDNQDLILTTNNLGNTDFYLLSSGKYEIEQIEVIEGYYLNNNKFSFEMTDDTIFKLDENNNKYLEIIVPNQKQTTKIQINKYLENYYDEVLVSRTRDIDIVVPIYANNDIYGKDGILLYSKDQEVDQAILIENDIISNDIYFGDYYILNPAGKEKINIILNSLDKKNIDIIVQIYEYSNLNDSKDNLEEIEKPVLSKPNSKLDLDILINEEPKQDGIKTPIKTENIKVIISDDKYIETDNNSTSMQTAITNKIDNLEEKNLKQINVPNTYTKKSIFNYLGYFLILISMVIIRKEKHENK